MTRLTEEKITEPESSRKSSVASSTGSTLPTGPRICPSSTTKEFDPKIAARVLNERDRRGAFGYRDLNELTLVEGFDHHILEHLLYHFGARFFGKWEVLPYNTQRPDGTLFPTAHAAMLRTGHVLFLPSWEPTDTVDTLLWDPTDTASPGFRYPAAQPTDYLFCSSHSFLADGQVLAVGGGGNFISNAIKSGWRFDPVAETWASTAASMDHARWYPTAVTLGDGRVFVASGYNVSKLEMYDPSSDSFSPITGPPADPAAADRNFPETYPGLHLLSGGEIFFSRTGWHGPDDTGLLAAYFRFGGPLTGEWVDIIAPDPMNHPDRTEGMSVLLFDRCALTRVLVVGGGLPDSGGRDSAEMINLSTLTPTWPHPMHLPEDRLNVNTVLLPDGNVFVLGGRPVPSSPCRLFDPATHSWSEMARLKYRREYHSVALLLPSGQVMTTGGDYGNDISQKTTIEIFSPPYLFRGARPKITGASDHVLRGGLFKVESPQAKDIEKVVLVRPMAVTHHTDSEQRVLQLDFVRSGDTLKVRAPGGAPPHHVAPPGYYMLFILNDDGVPSDARFIRLD